MTYPLDVAERATLRRKVRSVALLEAEQRATEAGRSIKCGQWNQHAPGGCQNDGTNCICECHDQSGSVAP